MQGHSHALSGAVAGLGAGILLHKSLPADVALSGFTAGGALLSDLDSCGASASRSLGLVSGALSHAIRAVSGGHRHLTHSAAGIAAFTALAWAGCEWRHDWAGWVILGLLVTIMTSSALEALRLTDGHLADVLGAGAAAAVIWQGYGLSLVWPAVAIGCAAHIAGDMATLHGCPLALPLSQRDFHLLPRGLRLSTGHWPERWLVVPALIVALVILSVQAANPGLLAASWHHATAFAR